MDISSVIFYVRKSEQATDGTVEVTDSPPQTK